MPTVALSVPAIARVHRPRPRTTARGRAPTRVARASAAGAPDEASAGAAASSSESDTLRKCAIAFVDRHVSSGDRVGVGAGPMVSLVLGEIHDRLADSRLDDVQAVPTGTLTAKEAAVAGVPVTSLENVPAVDVCVLQADEAVTYRSEKSPGIAAVVGREQRPVQPDLILTRQVIKKSVKVVLLTTELRDPVPLGGGVPVAIVGGQSEWEECAEELDDMFLGDAEVWRRGAEIEANPRGGKTPYLSPDGIHTIVDLRFKDPLNDGARWDDGFLLFGQTATPYQIAAEIETVDGVLAHGIVTQADCVMWPDAGDPSGVGEFVVENKGLSR